MQFRVYYTNIYLACCFYYYWKINNNQNCISNIEQRKILLNSTITLWTITFNIRWTVLTRHQFHDTLLEFQLIKRCWRFLLSLSRSLSFSFDAAPTRNRVCNTHNRYDISANKWKSSTDVHSILYWHSNIKKKLKTY